MNSGRTRKYGFNVYNITPEELLEYAAKHELSHIEINLTKKHSALKSFNRKRIDHLNRLTKKNSVELSLHLPHFLNIADIISPVRWTHLNYLKKSIFLAEQINATHITAHIGSFFWFPVTHWNRRNALNRYLKSLRKVIAICESKNVIIAIENVVPIPHGTDFYLLGDNIDDFRYIFENIDSDALRFCLDTGHANLAEGVLVYLTQLREKLVCIHYHDNYGKNDAHLPVGQGTVPWTEFVSELQKVPYHGPFISECRNIRPHEAAALMETYFTATTNE